MFDSNIPDNLLQKINVQTSILKNSKNKLFSFDNNRPDAMTLLHRAISYQSFEAFQYMLALRADMTVIDNMKNETPLHYAASIGDSSYLRLLINHYNEASLISDEENHVSKRQKLSLSLSEWVNLPNNTGKSALYLAITSTFESLDLMRVLLTYEGDLFLPDYFGVTPIEAAYLHLYGADSEENIRVASRKLEFLLGFINENALQEKLHRLMAGSQFMQKLIASRNEQSDIIILSNWMMQKKVALVAFFLQQIKTAMIWECDQSGKTLLHHAAALAALPIINLLLANRNEPINAASMNEGETVISSDSMNIISPEEQISKYINLPDIHNNTPLDELFSITNASCHENEVENRKNCFLFLLRKGADVFAGNQRTLTNDIVELQEKLYEYFFIESMSSRNKIFYSIAVKIRQNLRKIFKEQIGDIDFIPRPGINFEHKTILMFIQNNQDVVLSFYLRMLRFELYRLVSDKAVQIKQIEPILVSISDYAKLQNNVSLFLKSTAYPELIAYSSYINTRGNFDIYDIFRFKYLKKDAGIEQKKLIIDLFFSILSFFKSTPETKWLEQKLFLTLEFLPVEEGGDLLRDYFSQLVIAMPIDDVSYNDKNIALPRCYTYPEGKPTLHETLFFLIIYAVSEKNKNQFVFDAQFPICARAIKYQYSLVEKEKAINCANEVRDDFLSSNLRYAEKKKSKKTRNQNIIDEQPTIKHFLSSENGHSWFPGEFVLLVDLLIETNDHQKLRTLLLNEPGFFDKLLAHKMMLGRVEERSNKELSSPVFSFSNLLDKCSQFNDYYMKSSVTYFHRQIEKVWQPRLESIRKALSIKEAEFAHSKTRRVFVDAEIESIIEQLELFQQQLYIIYSDPVNFENNKRVYPHLPGCINAPALILDQIEERITSMKTRYRLQQFEMLCSFLLNNEEKLQAFTHAQLNRYPRGKLFTVTTKAKASPLLQDVPEENFLIVRKMVELFPELLDVRDFRGRTSLHWAMTGSTSTAYGDLLLELGADPFSQVYYKLDAHRTPPFFATFFSGATLEGDQQTNKRVVPALPNTDAKSPLEKREHNEGRLTRMTGAGKTSVLETGRKHVFMHVLKHEGENINRTTWTNMFNHVIRNNEYRVINELEEKPENKRGRKSM